MNKEIKGLTEQEVIDRTYNYTFYDCNIHLETNDYGQMDYAGLVEWKLNYDKFNFYKKFKTKYGSIITCEPGYYFVTKKENKMNKIKFRLEVWEKCLVFQILEMDKRFIKKDNTFTSKNGIEIWSRWMPELHSDTKIYLRGTEIKDDLNVSSLKCDSKEEAHNMKQHIIIALKDWAENWEGFKENKKVDTIVDNKQIFEF